LSESILNKTKQS